MEFPLSESFSLRINTHAHIILISLTTDRISNPVLVQVQEEEDQHNLLLYPDSLVSSMIEQLVNVLNVPLDMLSHRLAPVSTILFVLLVNIIILVYVTT